VVVDRQSGERQRVEEYKPGRCRFCADGEWLGICVPDGETEPERPPETIPAALFVVASCRGSAALPGYGLIASIVAEVTSPSAPLPGNQRVGWVEHSETQHEGATESLGFAPLIPSLCAAIKWRTKMKVHAWTIAALVSAANSKQDNAVNITMVSN